MKKKEIKMHVEELSPYSLLDGEIDEVITGLHTLKMEMRQRFPDATLMLDFRQEWDDVYFELHVSRLETDEEFHARQAKAEARREKRKQAQAQRKVRRQIAEDEAIKAERKLLLELLEKHGMPT